MKVIHKLSTGYPQGYPQAKIFNYQQLKPLIHKLSTSIIIIIYLYYYDKIKK